MSGMKELSKMQAGNIAMFAKATKIGGWIFIGLGGVLTITIIGAVIGIPLLIVGGVCLFTSKIVAKQGAVVSAATEELAEIHDHQLAKARESKTSQ